MSKPAGLSLPIVAAALTLAVWPSGADAFWERSHWAACSEAPTPAERLRRNCHVFVPVDHWPVSLQRWSADHDHDHDRVWRREWRSSPSIRK